MKVINNHVVFGRDDQDPGDEDDAIEKALARYLENIRAKKSVTTNKEKKL